MKKALMEKQIKSVSASTTVSTKSEMKSYEGVAISLFLHSPTWFQRRFTITVRNIRDNIPSTWAIQIFYTGKGQSQNAIDINKGLQRMIQRREVIMTKIPPEISSVKKKFFEMWTEKWLWENTVANRVLTFGGNSAICGNSPYTVESFNEWDYIGGPWDNLNRNGKIGGDGGISLRNRDAMLTVIDHELSKVEPSKRSTAYKSWGQEDLFFVTRMFKMNLDGISNFKVASRNATLTFSAIGGAINDEVLVASGTLPVVPFDEREKFLTQICPELKILYPSLHDPSCFGATPNGTKCATTICALRIPKRKGGC
jgi:hypothetical protein